MSSATPPAPRSSPGSSESAGLWLAGLGVLIFSFSTPMTKLAVRHLDAVFAGVGRAVPPAFASIVLLRVMKRARPTRGQMTRLGYVVVGVVVGYPLLTAFALHRVPSSHGSLAIGMAPLVTAGLGMFLVGERPSVGYWAASLVAFSAVAAYVVHQGGGSIGSGDAILLLAVVLVALGYAHGGLLGREIGGWEVICWALIMALPITVPVTAWRIVSADIHAPGSSWIGWGYTSLFSMFLGFFAWYGGLAKAGLARGGQLQLAQPVLALLWGWPILGERLNAAGLLTAAVVLSAVAFGRKALVRSTVSAAATTRSTPRDRNAVEGTEPPMPGPDGARF